MTRVAEVTKLLPPFLTTMITLFIITLLTFPFNQKYYLNSGITWGTRGRILVCDSDRDLKIELIFAHYITNVGERVVIYELTPNNTFQLEAVIDTTKPLVWDIGDYDLDGLPDLVLDGSFGPPDSVPVPGILITESPDSFSYPIQEVWRDTVNIGTVQPICAFDIDRDRFLEIVQTGGEPGQHYYIDFSIYESVVDNHYEVKYQFESPETPTSTIAFGDFDQDSLNEFVMGTIDGEYSIFESLGNNSYIPLFVNVQLPTVNIKDCFTVPDMDGDGKLEFVVKGFTFPDARFRAFIFEATANNTYQIKKTFILTGLSSWNYGGGYSDVGDLNGDGIAEIALEACAEIYLIKSAGNDSFYVWTTLPGNATGSSVRIFDIDNNGLCELIISGSNHTRIYEKRPIATWFCPTPYDTFYAQDTVYPRWRLDELISLDSLRLYWSHPQFGCHLIYQGLATDTMCSWVVPDTQSNFSNRFWLVTKGFGRYDSAYSPVFYIKRGTGIEETVEHLVSPNLEVYPNPFKDHLTIKFQSASGRPNPQSDISLKIYDATGRLVRQWDDESIGQSDQIIWDGTDEYGRRLSGGVYFVCLKESRGVLVKKLIKIIEIE